MKRYILLLLTIIISGIFIQGTNLFDAYEPKGLSLIDTGFSSWKEDLSSIHGIPEPAVHLAINSYFSLMERNLLKNDSLITIIDFSRPSADKRLFVLDIKNYKILKKTWVAHGMLSGVNIAKSFSNNKHSNKSSLGLYITNETYIGKHGYSLRLDGMSVGLNDNARDRAIVIHGASYVSEDFIQKNNRIGRSFGCPALPIDETDEIINLIKEGSCLYIYHPSMLPISPSDLEKLL